MSAPRRDTDPRLGESIGLPRALSALLWFACAVLVVGVVVIGLANRVTAADAGVATARTTHAIFLVVSIFVLTSAIDRVLRG